MNSYVQPRPQTRTANAAGQGRPRSTRKTNSLMKQLIISTVLLFLLNTTSCDASWLVFHKPEFNGKIVDVETSEPIEGAVVVAIYRTHVLAVGDSVDMNIDAREALTDKNGQFSILSYTTLINPFSWSNPVQFIVFKPGYLCNGFYSLEDEFSGQGTRPDRDNFASWNPDLKYRILKSGVLMLRKVSGKDRLESYNHIPAKISLFKRELPLANEIIKSEDETAIKLERQLRTK